MLKIIGQEGKYYILECDVCSKDTELYPEIRQLKCSFHSGKIPCGCAKIPKYSERQWEVMLYRALAKRSGEVSLVSLSGKFNAKCRVTLVNNATGNYRSTTLYYFITNPELDRGSNISLSKRSSEEDVISRVTPLLRSCNKELLRLYHKNYQWWVQYYCESCATLSNEGRFDIELYRLEVKGFNCKCHSKAFRHSREDVEEDVTTQLSGKGMFLGFAPEYTTYNTSVVEWVCNEGHNNKQVLSNMRRSEYACPRCARHGYNPEKPAYLYLVEFVDKGKTYLKYGITNRSSPDKRLRQIFKKKSYNKLLTVSSGGDTILELENTIKSNFKSGVNGLDITSGCTEVLDCSFKEELIKLVYNFTIGDI